MVLTARQRITVITLSEMIACTVKHELEVLTVYNAEGIQRTGYQGESLRYGICRQRNKRKTFYLDIRDTAIVFDGWDNSIQIESDVPKKRSNTSFMGDARYNFFRHAHQVPDDFRNCFELGQLNPFFTRWLAVYLVDNDNERYPLYPEQMPEWERVEITNIFVDRSPKWEAALRPASNIEIEVDGVMRAGIVELDQPVVDGSLEESADVLFTQPAPCDQPGNTKALGFIDGAAAEAFIRNL